MHVPLNIKIEDLFFASIATLCEQSNAYKYLSEMLT